MPRFVLEIGTEELPPRFFPPALEQLKSNGKAMFSRARLTYREVNVYGTPRRLTLIAEELSGRQAAAVREERGPSARVAFDNEEKPTKAALGFARRHGISPEELVVRATDRGEYVFAVIQEPELPAAEALASLLPNLITGLSFPKTMRWGTGALRFGRPIRWLLALVDDEVVKFELDGLHSGRLTRGHPVLDGGMHPLSHANHYEQMLRSHWVAVIDLERKGIIERAVNNAAGNAQVNDVDLMDETTRLVEWPTAACGEFDPDFLRLSEEVLIEEMRHVQNFFPLRDQAGKLLPRFVGVRDGGDEGLKKVVAGWERVLRAKLIDASYFYEQDLKKPLVERVEALRGVVFQEKLGTMYEKMERIRAIAADTTRQLYLDPQAAEDLDRAADLCKADLTTELVTEIPDLQGIMGSIYAKHDGEPQRVWEAIREHYHPRFAGDSIPITLLGSLLAISDKLDTLAACFSIGLMPTGSADPFALRRESTGVVRILMPPMGEKIHVSIERLFRVALEQLSQQIDLTRSVNDIIVDVIDFLRQRLETQLREEGIRYDLVDAALAVGADVVSSATHRARALQELKEQPDFLPTVIAATRVINITKGFTDGEVDPNLLQEDAEKVLWQSYQEALAAAEKANLAQLFDLFSQMREPIDRFFEEVLVMAEDEKLRRNRLSLCWAINQLFRRLADFSVVVQA